MSTKIKVEIKSEQIPIFLFVKDIPGQYRVQCGCGYTQFTLDRDQSTIRCGKCSMILATQIFDENIQVNMGQPLFMDVPNIGVFRMQCFCNFNEFAFTIDQSCFCCAACEIIFAKREISGAEADMSQAKWVL